MSSESKKVKKAPSKSEKKGKKTTKQKMPKINSEKILTIVFLLLLVLVIILGINVLNIKNKGVEKVKANVVIPIVDADIRNSLSVDISGMNVGEEKEYIFKIANYRGKKVNTKDLRYQIKLTKPENISLKLYKNDDNNNNLLDKEDTLEVSGIKLKKDKKSVDLYRLIIKSDINVSGNETVGIEIDS